MGLPRSGSRTSRIHATLRAPVAGDTKHRGSYRTKCDRENQKPHGDALRGLGGSGIDTELVSTRGVHGWGDECPVCGFALATAAVAYAAVRVEVCPIVWLGDGADHQVSARRRDKPEGL